MTDESEAARVCRDLYPRLVGALGLLCGDGGVAEDLAQEALARLWERWPTTRRPEHPMAWCYQVGANLARSAARRRTIEQRVLRRVEDDSPTADTAESVTAVLVVRAAVLQLPIRQRQVIVARHYLGLTVRETALAMRCAPGTVTALTHQAMASLRRSKLLLASDMNEDARHGRP
jgi:RNA polymerase sigma factor (sigma-70 family)